MEPGAKALLNLPLHLQKFLFNETLLYISSLLVYFLGCRWHFTLGESMAPSPCRALGARPRAFFAHISTRKWLCQAPKRLRRKTQGTVKSNIVSQQHWIWALISLFTAEEERTGGLAHVHFTIKHQKNGYGFRSHLLFQQWHKDF